MALADELSRIADEAARTRQRLEELSRACAELRAQLSREPSTTNEESPRKLQSVS
jgi:BMFP domain-containing protein YqiC